MLIFFPIHLFPKLFTFIVHSLIQISIYPFDEVGFIDFFCFYNVFPDMQLFPYYTNFWT